MGVRKREDDKSLVDGGRGTVRRNVFFVGFVIVLCWEFRYN